MRNIIYIIFLETSPERDTLVYTGLFFFFLTYLDNYDNNTITGCGF